MGVFQAAAREGETGTRSGLPQLQNVVPWLAGVVSGAGLVVLVFGWAFGIAELATLQPALTGMGPSTSISFLLCGAVLFFLCRGRAEADPAARPAAMVAAIGLIVMIALANLVTDSATGFRGIDEIVFREYPQLDRIYMAPATAIGFLAAATSLASLLSRWRWRRRVFSVSATTGLLMALLALTGYAFASEPLFEVFLFAAMTLQAAALFALFFAALLVMRPAWSWMTIVVGEGEGSATVRRLLPPVLIAPLLLAWLALQATNAGLFTVNFRLSLMAILITALLTAFLLWNGAIENRAEGELRKSIALLRETVAERDLLLREVYHRTKNNLQQIDALIAIESLQIEDEVAKESFRATGGRVRALGAVHQMLLSSRNLSSFSVDVFLQDLCADIAKGLGTEKRAIELRVDVQPEVVELDYAIPLGLLVNELVTNAFKYAFPGEGGGEIRIGYKLRDGGGAVLEVSDNGVGIPSGKMADERSDSVGGIIIQSLVGQLRAEMTVDGSHGTTVRVAVPAGVSGTRT